MSVFVKRRDRKVVDRQDFVDRAKTHLGYRYRLGTDNYIGLTVGYPTGRWDGAFIDVVLREHGVTVTPAHINAASALEYYIRNGETVKSGLPAVGDIVFFSFGDLHTGVVTDVSNFTKDGSFRTVEAQIDSGLPRASKDHDGIFERTRFVTDVLTFARPVFERTKKQNRKAVVVEDGTKLPLVKPTNFVNNSPRMRAATELIQTALGSHPAVQLENAARGRFDLQTRRAFSRLQRFYGYSDKDASGIPDQFSLSRLSREIPGLFRVPETDDEPTIT